MLLHLRIRDFAIIDAVELEFPAGFTVLTGETGAGKSILVNALGLVLGGRASGDLIRAGAPHAQVEALFDIASHPVIRARLEQRELVGDDVDTLLVRRVVAPNGRGKVIVNGHMTTVAALSEIVRGLVDISGQHEQQSLLVVESHLDILDAYAGADDLRAGVREDFDRLRSLCDERDRLQRSEDEALARADYVRFQLDEIERLAPVPGEDEELDDQRRKLGQADKLQGGARYAESLLYGEDGSAFDKLGKAAAEVQSLVRIDSALQPVIDGLETARRELQEAARELGRYAERVESDPARLEEVEARAAELKRLGRKHGGGVEQILRSAEALATELAGLEDAEARLGGLDDQIVGAQATLAEHSAALTTARREAARRLEKGVASELEEMDLGGAVFAAGLASRRPGAETLEVGGIVIGPSGADDLEFLWSANPGEPPRPLAKIASGGELSRLMLAVKSVLCNRDLVSLYVFDEVDTGLGGRAADCIGRKIHAVAQGHQAITITHLAPIAARADHHLRVSKALHDDRTTSSFELIEGRERADEIARMIDGTRITRATRQAAKEMLDRGR